MFSARCDLLSRLRTGKNDPYIPDRECVSHDFILAGLLAGLSQNLQIQIIYVPYMGMLHADIVQNGLAYYRYVGIKKVIVWFSVWFIRFCRTDRDNSSPSVSIGMNYVF